MAHTGSTAISTAGLFTAHNVDEPIGDNIWLSKKAVARKGKKTHNHQLSIGSGTLKT